MSKLLCGKTSNNTKIAGRYIEVSIQIPVFAYRIKQHRLAAGMTQKQLADALGMSRVHITNIETKATQTTIQTLLRMCDILGVTPNDLLL